MFHTILSLESKPCRAFHLIHRTFYSCYYLYKYIKALSVALQYTVRVKYDQLYYYVFRCVFGLNKARRRAFVCLYGWYYTNNHNICLKRALAREQEG